LILSQSMHVTDGQTELRQLYNILC